MLAEPRLAVFYSPPKFELKLHCDVDATTRDDDQEEGVTTWPDTGQLFGGDEEYQMTIADLTQCVSNSIDMVSEYSQVRLYLQCIFLFVLVLFLLFFYYYLIYRFLITFSTLILMNNNYNIILIFIKLYIFIYAL